jgi:hypothetical protein
MTGEADFLPAVKRAEDTLDAVLAELRQLTGLELRRGPQLAGPIDIRRVPDQEIHVAYLPSAHVQQVRRRAGGQAPSGGALPAQDGHWYQQGWAIVDTDLTIEPSSPPGGPPARAPAVLSGAGLAVLRHQLGHALGLGHAASRRVLMNQRIPVDSGGYTRGDRHGLALLGDAWLLPHDPSHQPLDERTVPCC